MGSALFYFFIGTPTQSKNVLHNANIMCLNEAVALIMATTVWKANKSMNPLGHHLFQTRF